MIRPVHNRRGLSLMEVLIALTIFLFSLVAIGRLVVMSGDRALDVQQQSLAAQLCQAKLAEVLAGAVPLSSQSDVPFDEDPDYRWSLDAQSDATPNLWRVQVRVTRERPDGSKIECSLSQMVLDPSQRGSTLDTPATSNAAASSDTSNSSSSTSSSGSASSQPSSSSSKGSSSPTKGASGSSKGGS